MNRQKSFEAQLKTSGVDSETATKTAKILAKDAEYERSKSEQAIVEKAFQQISESSQAEG
jgi:hypothetical protein